MGIGGASKGDVHDGTIQVVPCGCPGVTRMMSVVTIFLNLNFGTQGGMAVEGLDVSED